MFCSVRRYHVDPDDMDALLHRVDAEFCEVIESQPGFIAYEVLDCGNGACLTISTFRDRDGADASNALAASFVSETLSDIEVTRLDAWIGEVKVSRATAAMLQPAHA